MTPHFGAIQWNTKEDDTPQSFFNERAEKLLDFVDTPAALTREGRYLEAGIGIVGNEDGVHQHRLGQCTSGLP